MHPKQKEKELAIKLRKEGKTYSEILKVIPVAKSTLSLWLRDAKLSKRQIYVLTEKRYAAQLKGGAARRRQRIESTKNIKTKARKEVGHLSERDLWLVGAALYWAEGTKEKQWSTKGARMDFGNTDPKMIKLYLKWLFVCCKVPKEEIFFGIYIHDNHRHNLDKVVKHWSIHTGFPKSVFQYVYFQKHKPKTNRVNTGEGYYGTLRVQVRRSSSLNRKVAGWIEGMTE